MEKSKEEEEFMMRMTTEAMEVRHVGEWRTVTKENVYIGNIISSMLLS